MSDSINDIAIRMGVDAGGVEAGFKKATAYAYDWVRQYRAQVDAANRVGIIEVTQHDTHIEQKKAKDAEFFAWYKSEAEKEFNEWYAREMERERVLKEQDAILRQMIMNEHNARTAIPAVTGPMPAETLARGQELDSLEAAIRARYASLDAVESAEWAKEEAAQQKHWDRLRKQTQAAYADFLSEGQEFNNRKAQQQRDWIAEQARLLAQEREQDERERNLMLTNLRRDLQERLVLQARQAVDFAGLVPTRQNQDAHIAAFRANQARIQVGFGQLGGAAAQASYAVEDFIQVMAMGGGFNMAMMSASNNLSMVARSLLGTGSTMSLIAGSVLPLAIVGTVSLISYLLKEKDAVDDLKKAYDNLAEASSRRKEILQQELAFERERLSISRQNSVDAAEAKKIQLEDKRVEIVAEQNRLLREQANLTRTLKEQMISPGIMADIGAWKDTYKNLVDGPTDAPKWAAELENILKIEQRINAAIAEGSELKLKAAAEDMRAAIATSEVYAYGEEEIRNALRNADKKLESALSEENAQKFSDEMRKFSQEQRDNQEEMNALVENQRANEQILLDLKERQHVENLANIKIQEEALQASREEVLFLTRATDAQKALLQMQRKQQDFVGGNMLNFGGGIMAGFLQGQMDAANRQAALDFLMAQKDALLKEQAKQFSSPEIKGGLMQNAFDAQAEAFKQMNAAASKRPDPQIEKTNELLRKIEEAIKNGGVLKVVP